MSAWIPLQAVSTAMGPLQFARGSHRARSERGITRADTGPYRAPISDSSEETIWEYVRQEGFDVVSEVTLLIVHLSVLAMQTN